MITKWWVVVGLVVCVGVVTACDGSGENVGVEALDVSSIIEESDEYEGKQVKVVGRVGSVSRVFVYLYPIAGKREYHTIHCWFDVRNKDDFSGVRSGEIIAVRGMYSAYGTVDPCRRTSMTPEEYATFESSIGG